MRASTWILVAAALLALVAVIWFGNTLIAPPQPLIVSAGFLHERITPNADGSDDITEYRYTLSENARVSITFTRDDGRQFAFRQDELRARGDYSGLFSGVVDGYQEPEETTGGEVIRRLMPNGNYTWEIRATATEGTATDSRSGTFIIDEADIALPDLAIFSVSPAVFTPNQDGIDDRTQINLELTKDAVLSVYLLAQDGAQLFLAPRAEETREGVAGRYTYDYDGGVDVGNDPPPDGTYTLVAAAQDAVGQRIERRSTLTIQDGGKPLAEIRSQAVGADVVFTVIPYDAAYATGLTLDGEPITQPAGDPQLFARGDITMPIGDVLVFMLTIENYSNVPIRTHGAAPGTVYEQTQRAASLGDYDQSGAWRVGIDCDTAVSDYPWRWAVGDESVLEAVYDPATDNTYYYLPAGARAVVWGGIRMTELVASRNPQNCWAGLIHEDVAVSIRNSRVGARSIELVDPTAALYSETGE